MNKIARLAMMIVGVLVMASGITACASAGSITPATHSTIFSGPDRLDSR